MSRFSEMLDSPVTEIRHAYVLIDFLRPDEDGLFSSTYDMCSAVDIGTINRNLKDGYRIAWLEIVQS